MWRADRRDVHLEAGVVADEGSGCARVIEVDVAQEQVPNVGQPEPVAFEAALQGRDTRRRPAVEQRRPLLRVEEVRPDDALCATVIEVDQAGDQAILAVDLAVGRAGG